MQQIKTNKFLFLTLPSYLLIFLPVFLITGPFLSDLSLTLIATIFLINSLKNKLYSYYNNFFFKIFLLFYFFLIISSLTSSEYLLYSLSKSVPYIRFGLFSIGVFYLIDQNPALIKRVFYSLLSCFLILSLDGFLQFFTGENILGYTKYATRISSFFDKELVLGSYLARLFPILFAFFILLYGSKKNNFVFLCLVAIFVSSEVIIFLSGERTAFFFLNLSAIFILFLSPKFKLLRMLMLLISIFFIFLISLKFPIYKERIFDQTLTQLNISTEKNEKIFDQIKKKDLYIFSYRHNQHIISAYNIFLDNKVIGIGPKNFRNICKEEKYNINEYSCTTHPHNTYVQLLSETGLVGFSVVTLVFLSLIYFAFKQFIFLLIKKKPMFDSYQISLISAIFITLWPFAPSGSFFNNWISIIYFFPIGFLLQSFKKKN